MGIGINNVFTRLAMKEILDFEIGGRSYLLRSACFENAAFANDGDVIGYLEYAVEFVGDHDDGHPHRIFKQDYQIIQLGRRTWIQPGRRFIEE
jgi:hypothetical protein